MIIREIKPQSDWILAIKAEDGREGNFDVRPYLDYEAFADLRDHDEFLKVANGGYFVEWESGADLSATPSKLVGMFSNRLNQPLEWHRPRYRTLNDAAICTQRGYARPCNGLSTGSAAR